ncbi:MAG: hypothetical protein ACE5GO_00865, partial [Anaerolineales bacterium]
ALIGGMAFLVVAALWLGWDQIAPRLADRFGQVSDIRSPLAMVGYWLELSARWQAKQTAEASGWVQKTIRETPEWFNLPFLMSYGIVRPLLPAQLMAWSIPIWYGIGVWRALGWTLLLPLLVYAPLRAFRASEKRNLLVGLSIAVWVGILFASFWGGGDQWDNPRYRVSFISLQIALAAWVIIAQRHAPDPWMRRALVSVLAILAWFLPWYLRRYTYFDQVFGWTVVDLFKLLGLGVASAVLYVVGDLAIRNPGAQH